MRPGAASRRGRRGPRRAGRRAARLPPQGRQGDAVEHRRRHRGHDPADLHSARSTAGWRWSPSTSTGPNAARSPTSTAGSGSATLPADLAARPDRRGGRALRGRGARVRGRPVRRRSGRARADRGGRAPRHGARTAGWSGSGASCRGRSKQLSRIRFGTIGPSNHFVELQQVEEILDPDAAALLGVEAGPGDDAVPRRRRVAAGRARPALRAPQAVPAALAGPDGRPEAALPPCASARSLDELRRRQTLYFSDELPARGAGRPRGRAADARQRDGDELRLRVPARRPTRCLPRLAARPFGRPRPAGRRLAAQLDLRGGGRGTPRHRAPPQRCRAYPGVADADHPDLRRDRSAAAAAGHQPHLLVPLRRRRAGSGSLYSASHGAGSNIKRFVQHGLSEPDPGGGSTLRFGYAARRRRRSRSSTTGESTTRWRS